MKTNEIAHVEPVKDTSFINSAKLFSEGLISGALLNPINGVGQIINNTAHTHLPKIEFYNQKEVESSTAGVVGEVAGTLAGFVLTDGAFSAVAGLKAGTTLSMAASGAIQAGIFTPSDSSKTGSSFFVDRAENAAINAISLAGMNKISGALTSIVIFPSFTGRVASGAIAGSIGGGLNYTATSAIKGEEFTLQGLEDAGHNGLLFGAGFGATTSVFEMAAMSSNRPAKIHPDQPVLDVRLKGPISPEMQQGLTDGIKDMPSKIQKLLADSQTLIAAGERLTSIDRTLSSRSDRIHGAFRPGRGILLAEKTTHFLEGETIHPEIARYVFRHEAGHAVDHKLGRPSLTRSFKQAHQADAAEMPADIRQLLDYYVQSNKPSVGAKEAFAEIFAVLNGGAINRESTEAVQQYFPRTTELVRKQLAAIPGVKTEVEPQINFHPAR